MTLTLNDDLVQAARLTEAQMLQELAVALFQAERLTLAQAARLAELDRITFQHILASRRIPLHYGVEDFEDDLRTLDTLPPA
jgi:predicted HTH domain antitoxin